MLDPWRRSFSVPPSESTKPELEREQRKRQAEHERTEKLASMIADYRRQDAALRR